MDGRVNGSLNLSRALGDMEYKQSKHLPPAEQIVTAYPDVRQLQLGADVEFMILACDGIWDVLTNQQVQSTVSLPTCEIGNVIGGRSALTIYAAVNEKGVCAHSS